MPNICPRCENPLPEGASRDNAKYVYGPDWVVTQKVPKIKKVKIDGEELEIEALEPTPVQKTQILHPKCVGDSDIVIW